MEYIEALSKKYDKEIRSEDLLTVRPRAIFEHVTNETLEQGDPKDLLSTYYHWFSYYSYLTNKFHFIANQLENDYKDVLKSSVLDQSLGSSEKKREAAILQDPDVIKLQKQMHIATAKYKDCKSLLQLAEYSYALVSRTFTIKSTDIDLNRPL